MFKSNGFAMVLAIMGATIALGAIVKGDRISDEKFSKAMECATASFIGAAGAAQLPRST